jgi:hypothetical protein
MHKYCIESRRRKEYPAYDKTRVGQLNWADLAQELPSKHVIEGKVEGT